jgi:hypothetical protein
MTEVCPVVMMIEAAEEATPASLIEITSKCSCLPTRGVEQDLASGVSPLGTSHQGCVMVESELIFPNVKG